MNNINNKVEVQVLDDLHYLKNGKRCKKVWGHGINDADYEVQPRSGNGKQEMCLIYDRWVGMLRRCYSSKYKIKNETYRNVVCCKEWLLFSNFKSWMEKQKWQDRQLDKDLLSYKNEVYSPDLCIFVPKEINTFMIKSDKTRGEYPLGVSFYKKRGNFIAGGNDSIRKMSTTFGYANTPKQAHKLWQEQKIKSAIFLRNKYCNTGDLLIAKGLQRVIDKIQHDLDNNLITEDF